MFSFAPQGSFLKKRSTVTAAVFLMIFLSNGAWATENLPAPIRLMTVAALALGIMVCRKGAEVRVNRSQLALLCAVLLLQLFTIACHGFLLDFDVSLMMSIVSAFCFAALVPLEDFTEGLRSAVFFITLGSLFFFFLGYIVPMYVTRIPAALLQPTKWDDAQTFLFTFVVRNKEAITYYRSYGIFNEPGQYQIFLSLALIAELFHRPKPSLLVTGVLLAGYVVCNSANGFICAVLIFMAYFWERYADALRIRLTIRNSRKWLLPAGAVLVLAVVLLGRSYMTTALQEAWVKVVNLLQPYDNTSVGTSVDRSRAMTTALRIWLEHPITGYGYTGMHAYVLNLNSQGFIMTFSPLNWFARFGTLYGLLANGGYLAAFCCGLRRKGTALLMAAALLAMIAAQSVNANIYMCVLIFYGCRRLTETAQ